jgi:hypothetical protein
VRLGDRIAQRGHESIGSGVQDEAHLIGERRSPECEPAESVAADAQAAADHVDQRSPPQAFRRSRAAVRLAREPSRKRVPLSEHIASGTAAERADGDNDRLSRRLAPCPSISPASTLSGCVMPPRRNRFLPRRRRAVGDAASEGVAASARGGLLPLRCPHPLRCPFVRGHLSPDLLFQAAPPSEALSSGISGSVPPSSTLLAAVGG